MDKYLDILRTYWGYDSFRPLQWDIISSVSSGADTLALMPTGGGKSICFQVPAMARDGLCLVITPLIALMRDQVSALRARGIKATAIYTGLTTDEQHTAIDNCRFGDYKFLYLSPERLQSDMFLTMLAQMPVSMIAVDEAHCISQWGYDFRPSYLRIASVRQLFPDAPVLALTATATADVIDDIQDKLCFREKRVLRMSFLRKNLCYVVRRADNKEEQLLRVLYGVSGSSIVYVRNREKTKVIAELLINNGISATNYHAGLSNKERQTRQERWKEGEYRVMVATNAFGMGIDKPDVRSVIHLDLPDSLEAYYQEAGRAGRDQQTAYAVLIYNKRDDGKISQRVNNNYPTREFVRTVYAQIANYLQVGIDSGMGHTFAFDLFDFCKFAHLPMLPSYSAIQLLMQAGYIYFMDEHEQSPRVMMRCSKEELYEVHLSYKEDQLLQLIMRNYTGIFADPQFINDEMLARKLGMDKQAVNELLISLSQRRVIKYIPRMHTATLTYLSNREEERLLIIPPSILEERQAVFARQTAAMLRYAQSTDQCRSQTLLAYFGETDSQPCGTCDVCRKGKKLNG